jgi:hypothetical protein
MVTAENESVIEYAVGIIMSREIEIGVIGEIDRSRCVTLQGSFQSQRQDYAV